MINKIFAFFGYVPKQDVIEQLNYARSVAKRLDEHREFVEDIDKNTYFFQDFWHVGHAATQDDYLMRLFHMVHGKYPEEIGIAELRLAGIYVRPRPEVLGKCRLPEYRLNSK